MSDYIYQFNGTERGPVSFAELAAHIAAGEIQEGTLIRGSDSQHWIAAEDIPGLFRAAQKVTASSTGKTSVPSAATDGILTDPEAKSERRRRIKSNNAPENRSVSSAAEDQPAETQARHSRSISPFTVLLSVVIIGFAIYSANNWLSHRRRFPTPTSAAMSPGMELSLDAMRVPAADPPTLEIPVGKPLPVPGLENEFWVSSPSLSADLKKIVYLKAVRRQDDLYLAERSSKDSSFKKPVKLKCSTAMNEQFCSLSPDGTQLLFTVQEQPSRLHIASSADDFATSKPVVLTGIDVSMDNIDNAQWLSDTTFKFAAGDPQYTRRDQHVAERSDADGSFLVTSQLPLQNPWPRMSFSGNLERGYFANSSGIFITAPKIEIEEFGPGLVLLDSETIGPIDEAMDDPMFIVPKEDVIFFSGPGTGSSQARAPRLWMIRY